MTLNDIKENLVDNNYYSNVMKIMPHEDKELPEGCYDDEGYIYGIFDGYFMNNDTTIQQECIVLYVMSPNTGRGVGQARSIKLNEDEIYFTGKTYKEFVDDIQRLQS